jgi:site-specific recombinase XerD
METITKRANRPVLSETGEQVLAQYERRLRTEEDLTAATIRNYLSDPLFLSEKRHAQLTERGLGYVIKKYNYSGRGCQD